MQYSVFEIRNSKRILDNIKIEIETKFEKKFQQADSVMIMTVPDDAVIARYGYAKNEETDLLFM
ncbi:MAG: CRISPR-associated endonuclease Cas2 [Lentisphaeria bacterium]|nr:CRISPR-associated endonuclease Cas2 [Lentisphaeria bacterium]